MLSQNVLGPSTSLSGTNNSALQSSVLSDGALLSHSQPTREELKKSFETREGVYRNLQLAEFSRPRPLPQYQMSTGMANAAANQIVASGSTVRVSFLNLSAKNPDANEATTSSAYDTHKKEPNGPFSRQEQDADDVWADKICFNVGKELYVYSYRGTCTQTDLSRPIDKRVYKGTSPTFHAFNQETADPRSCQLIIGFSLGQLQIIDPLEKTTASPVSRLYNEDRFIDKTSVTCIRWLPGEPNIFLASYVSGNIYVYDDRIPPVNSNNSSSSSTGPPWIPLKDGEKWAVYTWKAKNKRNPVHRWQIGEGAIHQFNFSGPDAKMMATVGHDGFLRVFNYRNMELLAMMKSYFGGLLTLSWSPDAKLIATGGEDDLLTVYSVTDKRVVCRGQGHKSWISQVQFDPFLCTTEEDGEPNGGGMPAATTLDDVSKEVTMRAGHLPSTSADLAGVMHATSTFSRCSLASFNTLGPSGNSVCYRIGSVGHDTFLCLWDITEDMLVPANVRRHRNSTIIAPVTTLEIQTSPTRLEDLEEVSPGGAGASTSSAEPTSQPQPQPVQKPEKPKKKRLYKKALTLSRFTSSNNSNQTSNSTGTHKTGTLTNGSVLSDGSRRIPGLTSQISCCQETRLLGSKYCPGIRDVPMIEPLMCKKVSHDRLTVLEFREDCVVTACQEGFICTWGRPGKWQPPKRDAVNSPGTVSPEPGPKPSTSTAQHSYGYASEMSNGVPPSRSSSSYSNKV
ncbi:unnamed protein product [Caenorhabditis sp. 36 PRJEB53466]|nr:unnamed protein product [Caenorhabditis sp. 36 PRJEB53466]